MKRKKLLAWPAAVVASIGLAACGGSDEPEDAASIEAAPLENGSDDSAETSTENGSTSQPTVTTPTSVDRSAPTSPSDLTVTIPDEEPAQAGFTIIAQGNGETIGSTDSAYLAWEMVDFATGEVVESTAADFGGPVVIPLGSGAVPAALEDAIVGQKVGTRLEVVFPAGMEDLPPQFDANQAHVLAVEIVELVADAPEDDESAAPESEADPDESDSGSSDTDSGDTDSSDPETSDSSTTQPTTTTPPAPVGGLLVPADGPLTVVSPAGSAFPTKNDWEYVTLGSGAAIQEGDTVQLEYVMVSWRTGDVVKSTAQDFGGPQSIVLGQIEVPRYLESAIFQKPVGTRLQVIYEQDLFDLPEGLDRTDAYVLAVDIVGRS